MVKKHKVSLFGETYTLVSDESEEHIVQCVEQVDALMRSITESMKVTDGKRAAILAALQFASKNRELEETFARALLEQEKLVHFIERELTQFSS